MSSPTMGWRKKVELPSGVQDNKGGNYEVRIAWGAKYCYVGSFVSVDKAAAAFEHMKEERGRFSSAAAADESSFEAARTKAIETVGGAITRRGLSSRQKGVVKAHIARNINREGKLKTPGQVLDNLVVMVANDEDDRAVLRKQIKSYIWTRCLRIRQGRLQNDDTCSVVSGATDLSFVGVDPEEVLGSIDFGQAFGNDQCISSDDDDASIDSCRDDALAAKVAVDVAADVVQASKESEEDSLTSNLATLDDDDDDEKKLPDPQSADMQRYKLSHSMVGLGLVVQLMPVVGRWAVGARCLR